MALKTDYKNEVLNIGEEYRKYNILTETGEAVQRNVHLTRAYSPRQEGDDFGANDINTTNAKVNELEELLGDKANRSELSNKANKTDLLSYATTSYVDEQIAQSEAEGNYATKSDLEKKADKSELSGYATNYQLSLKADKSSLSNYATTSAMNNALYYKANTSDLDNYATNSALSQKADKSSLSNYATTSQLYYKANTADLGDQVTFVLSETTLNIRTK